MAIMQTFFFKLWVLGIKLRSSHLKSKHFTNKTTSQASSVIVFPMHDHAAVPPNSKEPIGNRL